MRIIGETIGRPLRFEEQSREEFGERLLQGAPPPAVDFLLDLLASMDGMTAQVLPTVEEVTGRPAFTYAQWAAHHAAKFNSTPG